MDYHSFRQERRETPKYPRPPRSVYGTKWSYCETVILWNSIGSDFVWSKLSTTAQEAPFHFGCAFPMCIWCRIALRQIRECFTVPMHTTTMQINKFWNKKWGWSSRFIKPRIYRDLNSAKMNLLSKFVNPNSNRWWVMVWTNSKWGQIWVWCWIWPWRSDTGNDNTRRPKLPSG